MMELLISCVMVLKVLRSPPYILQLCRTNSFIQRIIFDGISVAPR